MSLRGTCAGENNERRSLSGFLSCADGGQAGPAPLVNHPAHLPRPLHSSCKTSRGPRCVSQNMRKNRLRRILRPCGSDRNAHITDAPSDSERINCVVAHISRFKPACRSNHTIENRVGCTNNDWVSSIRTSHGKVLPPTHICAFRSLFAERTEKCPAGTFSHVSAGRTQSAQNLIS